MKAEDIDNLPWSYKAKVNDTFVIGRGTTHDQAYLNWSKQRDEIKATLAKPVKGTRAGVLIEPSANSPVRRSV